RERVASLLFIHPRFRQLPPPLIVIGAHRSGTSVVSGMLAALGVYMGAPLSHYTAAAASGPVEAMPRHTGNGEAPEFYLLNECLLARAGAAWNRLDPFLNQRNQPAFASSATRLLQLATFGALRRGYLGSQTREFAGPWGWK